MPKPGLDSRSLVVFKIVNLLLIDNYLDVNSLVDSRLCVTSLQPE